MKQNVTVFEYVNSYMELTKQDFLKIRFYGWKHIEQGLYKKVIPQRQTWIPIKSLINNK